MIYSSENFGIETAKLAKQFYPEKGNLLSKLHAQICHKILSRGLTAHWYFKYKPDYPASTHLHDLWITSEHGLDIG